MDPDRSQKRSWQQGEKPETQRYFKKQAHKDERKKGQVRAKEIELDCIGKPMLYPSDDPKKVQERIREITRLHGRNACIAPYCGCEYYDYCDGTCDYCHGACE